MSTRIKTVLYPSFVKKKEATKMFRYLRDNVEWEEGVKSKGKHTRLACSLGFGVDVKIDEFMATIISKLKLPENIIHLGMYINYQRNGNEWTPNHSHKKSCQVVVCLGPATRTFIVGKKEYHVSNGDVIIFGSSIHGVKKEPDIDKSRISIATFSMIV
jgi:hypothetical protein